jgi:hypothetical protein
MPKLKPKEPPKAEAPIPEEKPLAPLKRPGRPPKLSRRPLHEIIDALTKCQGNITQAAKQLGCSRNALMTKINGTEALVVALNDITVGQFDNLRTKLYSEAMAGKMQAMSLYLQYSPTAVAEGWISKATEEHNHQHLTLGALAPSEEAAVSETLRLSTVEQLREVEGKLAKFVKPKAAADG